MVANPPQIGYLEYTKLRGFQLRLQMSWASPHTFITPTFQSRFAQTEVRSAILPSTDSLLTPLKPEHFADRLPGVHQAARLQLRLHLGVPAPQGRGLHPVLPPGDPEDAQERQAAGMVPQHAAQGVPRGNRGRDDQHVRHVLLEGGGVAGARHGGAAAVLRRGLLAGCGGGHDPAGGFRPGLIIEPDLRGLAFKH